MFPPIASPPKDSAFSSFAVHLKKIREKLAFLSTLFMMYQRDSRDRENSVLEVQQNILLVLRTLIIKQQMPSLLLPSALLGLLQTKESLSSLERR